MRCQLWRIAFPVVSPAQLLLHAPGKLVVGGRVRVFCNAHTLNRAFVTFALLL